MISRRRALKAAFGAAALLATRPSRAADPLKFGTLAAKTDLWGQVFAQWSSALATKTAGAVQLDVYYGGQMGDEAAMIDKMRRGELHGAALSFVGLSKVYKPCLAAEMPLLCTSWTKVDAVRNGMKATWTKGLHDSGLELVGWSDLGLEHVFTRARQVKTPADVKGGKPWVQRDDPAGPSLYQAIGGVTPVSLSVGEVFPNLGTGAVDIVIAPSLAVEQLAWSTKLDSVLADVFACRLGAIVLTTRALEIVRAHHDAVLDTATAASNALLARVRAEDSAAYTRLSGKMTVVTSSSDERQKWATVAKVDRERLAANVFTADVVSAVEALAK